MREFAVEAVGPEHAGTVRSQVEALRRLAEGEDVVGAAYVIMHHGRRARRIAGQAQLEVAHPYDVVPVDVQGYQVVSRQGEQSGGIVRHLLAGAIGPELEEAFVAGGQPGVAGGVLGDGGDAVELAGSAGEEFLFPALGGRIVEEVVRAVGVKPQAAALVGVQSGDIVGGQGAVGFGAGDFLLVSGAEIGPEKSCVRGGIVNGLLLRAGDDVFAAGGGELHYALLGGAVHGQRIGSLYPEQAVVRVGAYGYDVLYGDAHCGEGLFFGDEVVLGVVVTDASL